MDYAKIIESAVVGALLAKGYSPKEAKRLVEQSKEYIQTLADLVKKGKLSLEGAIQSAVEVATGSVKEKEKQPNLSEFLTDLVEVIRSAVEESVERAFERAFKREAKTEIEQNLVKHFLKYPIALYNALTNPTSDVVLVAANEALQKVVELFKLREYLKENHRVWGHCPRCGRALWCFEEWCYCPHCDVLYRRDGNLLIPEFFYSGFEVVWGWYLKHRKS